MHPCFYTQNEIKHWCQNSACNFLNNNKKIDLKKIHVKIINKYTVIHVCMKFYNKRLKSVHKVNFCFGPPVKLVKCKFSSASQPLINAKPNKH